MRWDQPATAAFGLGYVALGFAGLALAPLPDLGSSPTQDSAYLSSIRTTPFVVGGLLELLAYLALLAFLVHLVHLGDQNRLARSRTFVCAGATLATTSVTIGLALAGALVLQRAAVPQTVATTLLDAASLITWGSTPGLALALGAIGWYVLRTEVLPGWMGWAALLIAFGFLVCLPLADTGAGHLPAIAADLWILTASVAVLTRRTTKASLPSASAPNSMAHPG